MYLKDNLLVHFDISNINSYNRNEFIIKSLNKSPYQITNNINLNDYGLTQYDIGKVTSLTDDKLYSITDKFLKLTQVKKNNNIGITDTVGYEIDVINDEDIGYYFKSNGGYLNNPFKYHKYNIEYLPRQYKNGFTFETTLLVNEDTFKNTDDNSNIFLYLGIRAEDKFAQNYIGNFDYINNEGVQLNTSYDVDLTELNNNVLAFKFNSKGNIGYRRIIDGNIIQEDYSTEISAYEGWNHIVITYRPDIYDINYNNTSDIDDECDIFPRNGTLSIFVNGILFYKNILFVEPSFRGLDKERSTQIGLPYNISWGGGSFGLKHSYNFNQIDFNKPYDENPLNYNLLIEQNFDGYFKGGFQKLRIYDKTLNLSEILNNYRFESDYYKIQYNKGGRIININNFNI